MPPSIVRENSPMSEIDRIEHLLTNLQGLSMEIWGGGKGKVIGVQQLNLQEKMQVEAPQQESRNGASLV